MKDSKKNEKAQVQSKEIEKIKKQLSEFKFEELLFLDHINEIIINIHNCLCRKILSNKSRNNNYTLCELKDGDNVSKWKIKNRNGSISSSKKNYQLSLAYNLNKDSRESIIRNGFLYSFFKTDIKMPFPFLIHGTFNLSSERNSLIKQDNENRELLLILIDFIAEFAIEISKEENDGICGYEPLKCLIPSGNFGVLDDQYDFGNLLKNKIKNLKIFPCINDEYVCLNDEPKYSDNRFDLFVNKTSFSKLLKHCDESYIVEYLTKQLNVSFYKVDEMTNLLNKDSSFYVSENRNFDLIKLFENFIVNTLPFFKLIKARLQFQS